MQYQDNQVSTKEFLKKVLTFFKFIGSKWQILLIALLLGTSFDLLKNYLSDEPVMYDGKITFHLDLEGGGQSQLGGLASSFGLGGGSAVKGGGDLFGASNFEAIMLSLNVFQNAFMKKVKVGNKEELFVNYFIDSSDVKTNEWAGNLFRGPSAFANYRFTQKDPRDFTQDENMIITELYTKLLKTTKVTAVESSSLINIVGGTTNEILTKVWLETLMRTTEDFYKEMKTKKNKQLLVIQERRLDSLSYLLKTTDRKMARVTFENPNVVDPAGIMKQQQVNRDNSYITNQYMAQMANVENLNRLIFEQTPIFTVLEPVRLPLATTEKTGLVNRLNGIISFFVMLIILIIWRSFKDLLDEVK
jgi:hypothetical protein